MSQNEFASEGSRKLQGVLSEVVSRKLEELTRATLLRIPSFFAVHADYENHVPIPTLPTSQLPSAYFACCCFNSIETGSKPCLCVMATLDEAAIFGEDGGAAEVDEMEAELMGMSTDDIMLRTRLIDNEIRVLRVIILYFIG